MIRTLTALSICALTLAACGGGNSGGSRVIGGSDTGGRIGSAIKSNRIAFLPTPAPKSSHANAAAALRQNLLDARFVDLNAEREDGYRGATGQEILNDDPHTFRPIRDTNAEAAWRLGWTGDGVRIGVLDGFSVKNIPVDGNKVSHGEAVSFIAQQIAPEATIATRSLTFGCNRPAGLNERQTKEGFGFFEQNGYHIVNNSWGFDRYKRDICSAVPNPGLLPADIWNDLIAQEKQDPSSKRMIVPISDDDAYHANMLFIFAAGNDGQNCFNGIGACNLLAAAIDSMRQDDSVTNAGERVLFVGALSDDSFGTDRKSLARYSHPAGDMVNDFIVAHDDIFEAGAVFRPGDGSGTSFAAPRVAGAAAIVRHKFPSLNGPKLKQVLLKSADDLGTPGPDIIFGHGQLNVVNALSPIDGLTK